MANKNKQPAVSEKVIFDDERKARVGARVGRMLGRRHLGKSTFEKVRKGQEEPHYKIVDFTRKWREEAGRNGRPFHRVNLSAPASSERGTPHVVIDGLTDDRSKERHIPASQGIDRTSWSVAIGTGKTLARFAVNVREFGIFHPVDIEPIGRGGHRHQLSDFTAREQVQAYETVARAFDTIDQAQAEGTLRVSNPTPRPRQILPL